MATKCHERCHEQTDPHLGQLVHKEEHLKDADSDSGAKHGGGNMMSWGCFGGGNVKDAWRSVGSILPQHVSLRLKTQLSLTELERNGPDQ